MRIAALVDRITVYHKTVSPTPTRYGDAVLVDDAGTTLPARVRPFRLATEVLSKEDRRTIRYQVVCAPDVTIDALDRIEWNGASFEVEGQPGLLTNRNGPHHYEFIMRQVLGI